MTDSNAFQRFSVPRVAIIHYWLVTMRGGERVLERLIKLYPNADIFTHVYNPNAVSDIIRSRPIYTTFINNLPASRTQYQKYLPLMPRALERLDLTGYDLIISSESGPAKGVIPPPHALHVCYAHSPMRYLWDQHALYRQNASLLARLGTDLFFNSLRTWDVTTAARVDRFAANSAFVGQRIQKYYRRNSTVIYPPVNVDEFQSSDRVENFYLWVSQFTAYKRPELAIDAFNKLGLPLIMVGAGPIINAMRKRAGPNIRIVERMPFSALKQAYRTTQALIFTAEEDFGIVPVEAMASGRPVIALGRGGALETVRAEVSGLFFDQPNTDSLIDAVERFSLWAPNFDSATSKGLTVRFSPARFDTGMSELIGDN